MYAFNAFFFVTTHCYFTAFQHIKSTAPADLGPFVSYFENTYIGTRMDVVHRVDGQAVEHQVIKLPRFPIGQWNVHEATLSNNSRANNICEGFNNAFSASLTSKNHPVIWKVSCFIFLIMSIFLYLYAAGIN